MDVNRTEQNRTGHITLSAVPSETEHRILYAVREVIRENLLLFGQHQDHPDLGKEAATLADCSPPLVYSKYFVSQLV